MDIKSLAKRTGTHKENYKQFLKLFIESATYCVRRIEIYYQQEDFQAIMTSAHNLKGSSITMGLQDMYILFDQLESDVKKENLYCIPLRIEDIKKEIGLVSTCIGRRRKKGRCDS